jgi:prolyl-tRNA editing enzyme YbaK/EbsC (Cys-tRNA(Pro) deacylase)
MAIPKRVLAHLKKTKMKFEVVPHKTVYTAYDLAQTLGEKLENIAKTLLIKVELPKVEKKAPRYYMVAVPASYRIDLRAIQKYLKALKVELAKEKEMAKLGMLPGAGTPFVSMYKDVGLLMDHALARVSHGLVRAESFTDSLRVKIKDLIRSEQALVVKVGSKGKLPKIAKTVKKTLKKAKKPAHRHRVGGSAQFRRKRKMGGKAMKKRR